MLSFIQSLNMAIRHRPLLSQLIALRQDPSIAWRGSLSEAEHGLLRLAVEKGEAVQGPIIEIGTLFGFTTAMIASWMGAKRRLITVDNYSWNPWGLVPEVHLSLTQRILSPFMQTGGIEIVDMDSETFFSTYVGLPPSLVFIDADHSYAAVHRDIAWAKRIGAAIIGGHDYSPKSPGVMKAVDEHFSQAIATSETVWMWGLDK